MTNASVLAFLDDEIERLQQALQLLGAAESDGFGSARGTRRKGAWHMSAEARARISAARKARWAKRKAGKSGNAVVKRRKMSAEAAPELQQHRKLGGLDSGKAKRRSEALWAELKSDSKTPPAQSLGSSSVDRSKPRSLASTFLRSTTSMFNRSKLTEAGSR